MISKALSGTSGTVKKIANDAGVGYSTLQRWLSGCGSATITEQGQKLDITQHTQRAVIDWRSFHINANELHNFSIGLKSGE